MWRWAKKDCPLSMVAAFTGVLLCEERKSGGENVRTLELKIQV